MAKNFKPGQKVVYKDDGSPAAFGTTEPKDGGIYTINNKSSISDNHWFLKEMPQSQSTHERCLFPLKPKSITLELHEVNLEPRKVIESQPIHAQ